MGYLWAVKKDFDNSRFFLTLDKNKDRKQRATV